MLARYLVENLSSHNIWAFKMLITESIYFLNVFGNIYLMDVFLGGEFRTYGIQVLGIERRMFFCSALFFWHYICSHAGGQHDAGGP